MLIGLLPIRDMTNSTRRAKHYHLTALTSLISHQLEVEAITATDALVPVVILFDWSTAGRVC